MKYQGSAMKYRSKIAPTLAKAWFSLLLAGAAWTTGAAGAEDLNKAIADADLARGSVPGGAHWQILVHTIDDDKEQDVSYEVKSKGAYARMTAVSPAQKAGEGLLFRDGDMYFHKPGVKRPVVIGASQKLSGPASNGDISVTNYQRDYDATLVGDEVVAGVPCMKLLLKAKAGRKPSYSSVRYWVSKDHHLGLKAEFLTASGDVFKTAEYKYAGHIKVDGQDRPFLSGMIFHDAAKPKSSSEVTLSEVALTSYPDTDFDLKNFSK